MSPRRNTRRLEQMLPSRADAGANRPPLRVVAMPLAPVPEGSVSTPAPHEKAAAGSLLTPMALRLAAALPHLAGQALQVITALTRQAWHWLCTEPGSRLRHSKTRRLRLAETLSLGEKRFVSLVEVDGQAFLIGGTSSGISLLAECPGKRAEASFGSVMEEARWPEKETA